jgi:E3 ubiquitin-protein ligase HUWE1
MEDVHFQPQDDMEDDGLEADDDVEMDYADETGSEDTSHTEEEEDVDLDAPVLEGAWQDEDGDVSGLIENDDAQDDLDEGDATDDDDQDNDEEHVHAEGGVWQVGPLRLVFTCIR